VFFIELMPAYRDTILNLTVLVSGAVVMIYEIVGSRILSPYIGTSTYTWTSLIGIILASLSLGYWLGGRTADRQPEIRILAAAVLSAGGLIAATVLVKDVVLSIVASTSVSLEIKAVAAALLLFAPASVCLGFVTPFAVKLKLAAIENTGGTVGSLYALSTVGSIAGTFAAGFLLIPFVGSVRTLYILAASLIVLSALLFPAATRSSIGAVVLFFLSVGGNEAQVYLLRVQSRIHDIDTEYSRVRIFEMSDPTTGRQMKAIATDPYFVQSAMFMDGDELALSYSRYYHLLRHFRPDVSRTLLIGGAGYSFPKEYLRTYPEAAIDVAEIDPGMTDIARRHFRLADDVRLTVLHQDGRMVVNAAPAGAYNVLLMDAFGSLFSVPTQLTTLEAVAEFHRILDHDGVVIFNLGSALSGEASRFLHAEIATYRAVFPNVLAFKVKPELPDERLQNVIIVALKSRLSPQLVSDDPFIAGLLAHHYDLPPADPALIITDDLAPVEHYNSIAQNIYLSEQR
jgi:spermidine synthase